MANRRELEELSCGCFRDAVVDDLGNVLELEARLCDWHHEVSIKYCEYTLTERGSQYRLPLARGDDSDDETTDLLPWG